MIALLAELVKTSAIKDELLKYGMQIEVTFKEDYLF